MNNHLSHPSKKLTPERRIGALGPAGTYSHLVAKAIQELYPADIELITPSDDLMSAAKKQCPSMVPLLGNACVLDWITQAVNSGNLAVIPFYNPYGTDVTLAAKSLAEISHTGMIHVVGVYALHIRHVLAGKERVNKNSIQTVYSHPQALLQCHQKLGQTRQISTPATTTKANNLQKGEAILCSAEAAEQYSLEVLDGNMAPDNNYTSFAIVGHEAVPELSDALQKDVSKNARAILHLSIENIPGALAQALPENSQFNIDSMHSFNRGIPSEVDFALIVKYGDAGAIEQKLRTTSGVRSVRRVV